MNLSSLSIRRPVLAIVMNVIILLFGVIGFQSLGVREFPSIDPPVITVRTSYSGANAEIIESQITEPLEKAINGIAGIKSISSASNQGSSNITIEFDINANLEAAANDVRDKVSQAVRSLPQDIDGVPTVEKADANSDPIISMSVKSDSRNILELSDFAENVIAERVQTIPDVSSVRIWGQKRFAMRLWLDPQRLAAYKLTPLDVKQALDRENVELPSGKIAGNNSELVVKTVGKLLTVSDFEELIIKEDANGTIKFKDIGKANLGPENEETILRVNGIAMVAVAVIPQPGANYINIADEFYKRVEKLKADVPQDIELQVSVDNTIFVRKAITEVKETIFIAIGLVVLIIFLFFRDWAIAFRPLIDIPVSLVGAFFIMYMMDYSINVLSLLAIVLATGLVVDDGIVVTENIYKKVEGGMNPVQAAIVGSKEIFFAVISTSVTLAAVFLPVIFMDGFIGKLFQEFGVVLAGSVLISAFVSLTLTPMLNAYLTKSGDKKSWFYEKTEPFFRGLEKSYGDKLRGFMRYKWLAFPVFAIMGVGTYYFYGTLKEELAPVDDRSWLRLMITAPEGATYEYTDRYLYKLVNFINDSVPERKFAVSVTAPGFSGSGSSNTGFVRLMLNSPEERKRSQQEIYMSLLGKLRNFNEARCFILQQQTIQTGGFGSQPVQFVIQAPEFQKLVDKVPKFMEEVNKSPILMNADVNLKFNKPELYIQIDREKARALDVNVVNVAQTLQLSLSGLRYGYFNMNGKQYQVVGQVDRANRDEPLDLKSLFVRNQRGDLVQLDNIVKVEERSNPPQLYHYNRFKSATVSAALAPGKTVGDGIAEMKRIAKLVLDDTFSTELTGSSRDFAESSGSTSFAFILALILVYLILAAQFESFIDPFVIMLTVPLALGGAVFSLWFFNQTLNIFSQIGIIMLVGLVTKNGILIVEFANQLRETGMNKTEAVINAAASRFRPILMTSFATMLGALPIALALGAGSKSRMGMGIVIIGGLLFSLTLTLYVIPAMYSYLSRQHSIKSEEEIMKGAPQVQEHTVQGEGGILADAH
ncbi:MAG: efflux RND transporter permease subunit [Saprospiraceae bacterium]|nr:efflux RND transporter permease subunit [Saprospiraceae bacterium]